MNRILALSLCLLLAFGCTLGLTGCSDEPAEPIDIPDDHAFEDDIPALLDSDAAYLLDMDFAITADNFSDCMTDFFAAPAVFQYYFSPLHQWEIMRILSEKVTAFAEPFHAVPLTALEDVDAETWVPEHASEFDRLSFRCASISLMIYGQEGLSYLILTREHGDEHERLCFAAEGTNLIPALEEIAVSLQPYAEQPPAAPAA